MTTDRDVGSSIATALNRLSSGATDAEILDLLDAAAVALVSDDLIHVLAPHAARLAVLDYDHHPWAALPAGVAVCSIDWARGREVLGRARNRLEQANDSGAAFAWFLEGLQDLGEGKLESATEWLRKAHASLDPNLTAARLSLAHMALGAYERGALGEAILLAEEAIWSAERVGDLRTDAVASLYAGFFHLYTGRFTRCGQLIERASQSLEQLEPEERYELPLVGIERGALAALHGDDESSDAWFEAGIDCARVHGNDWYEAIGLVARSEFTAQRHPGRAVTDAHEAIALLEPSGESWWSRWARLALATAHLHTACHHAGQRTCLELLETDLTQLERGRTLLVLSEHQHRAGEPRATSQSSALESSELLLGCGADYWAARALLLLARVDSGRSEFHRRKARRLSGADGDDPAWRRVLRGPGRLDIRLLGCVAVTIDGTPVHFPTRAEEEVVAMLACAGGSIRTTVVGDRLWPDDDPNKVTHRLDNLISSLRRSLLPTSRLRREHGQLHLDFDPDECDLTRSITDTRTILRTDPGAIDKEQAHALADTLRRPLLGSLEAPWTLLEQEKLDELAEQLVHRAS